MIDFRKLSDVEPALQLSPLLRAAHRTMQYAAENNGIGLTATKAFQRKFVHWAVEHVDWSSRREVVISSNVSERAENAQVRSFAFFASPFKNRFLWVP